jgi:hypothetical protein
MTDQFYVQADAARERYVSFYRRAIEQMKGVPNLAVELLVQPSTRNTPRPFCLMRVDAIHGHVQNPTIQHIADSLESPTRLQFRLAGGMQVFQTGFCWEALTITFDADEFEVEVVREWLNRWLDPEETRKPDAWGLSSVVHDLAWSREKSQWRLKLDFGSAPTEALKELLGLLWVAGIHGVTLSRDDLDDA